MDREFYEHGLAERRRNAAATATGLLVSPNGIAHFAGCPHKGIIRTTAGGPSLTRHAPGNVWETGSGCGPPVGGILALPLRIDARTASATVRGDLALPKGAAVLVAAIEDAGPGAAGGCRLGHRSRTIPS